MTDELQASFVIAIPPGWMRLPARAEHRSELARLIEQIVEEALPSSLPRDSAEPWRGELRKRLNQVVLDAEDAGASAVYLPVRPINGVTIPASFTEAEIEDDGRESADSLLTAILEDAESNATSCVIDGAPAARIDRTTLSAQPAGDWPEVTSRQIVYTIQVPHREGRWVVISFSAISGDNPSAALSDALVALFDALILTFQFTDLPGAGHSALEARLEEIATR